MLNFRITLKNALIILILVSIVIGMNMFCFTYLASQQYQKPEILELQDNQEVFYTIYQTVTTWNMDAGIGVIKRDTIYVTNRGSEADIEDLWEITNTRLYYKENPITFFN